MSKAFNDNFQEDNSFNTNLSSHTSPISKIHQKSYSSPKLINNNIKTLIARSNKYLLDTNHLLSKTKTILTGETTNQKPDLFSNESINNNTNYEIIDNISLKNQFKTSFSPQYSFLNNIAPSFVSSIPNSNNPSFSNSSLSKFRNFAYILSLNEKNLTKLPAEMIINKSNLQILELKNNKLKIVPMEIALLPNLKCLKLDGNYLKEIPKELCFSLKQLEILSVYDNILTKLPDEISYWKDSLIYLNVAENHLDQIPIQIGSLLLLNSLHLEHNHFTLFPKNLTKLDKLKEFGLDWFKYASPPMKTIQHWKGLTDQAAQAFYSLRKDKLDDITFERFVQKISLKSIDFKRKIAKQRTLIHKAAIENDIGVLRALLTINYDEINKVDEEDQTALFLSIRNENYLAAKVLLHNGANPQIGGGVLGSCLNLAAAKCQYYLVSDLLKYGANGQICDVDGNNALHVLMCLFDSDVTNNKKIAELLINYGVNPNGFNKQKWTPAHLAIKRGQMEAVKWILDFNSAKNENHNINEERNIEDEANNDIFNLNLKGGEEKMTCLHLAAQQNNILLVESLIERGQIEIFSYAKNEKLASSLAIQNPFLYKILKTYERNYLHQNFVKPLAKEKRLAAFGKDLRLKSEAEVSEDSSDTRTFQKVNDLNEVTKDKRIFLKKNSKTLVESPFLNIIEPKTLFFNKFNQGNGNCQVRVRPIRQPTQESLNETQISDIDENKSDIDIIYELEEQRSKNMRSFFGSPNNIRQIDALQKMNYILKNMKSSTSKPPLSNYTSLVSKKLARNHIKFLKEGLDETVENLKKIMKNGQSKILDITSGSSLRVKYLNTSVCYHFKLMNLVTKYQEEKQVMDQFKQILDLNPNLNLGSNNGKPLFYACSDQNGLFFNQTHITLALRWLVYLFLNLPTTSFFSENINIKAYMIRLFVNFYYENASSNLQNLYNEAKEPMFLRYEAYQGLLILCKEGFKTARIQKENSLNSNVNPANNSSLKINSMELSKEITSERVKNFGSNYFSNKKQILKNESIKFGKEKEENHVINIKNKKNKEEIFSHHSMVTINSSEIEDEENKNGKTLLDELKNQRNEYERMKLDICKGGCEEKYKFEGFHEKENRKISEL